MRVVRTHGTIIQVRVRVIILIFFPRHNRLIFRKE